MEMYSSLKQCTYVLSIHPFLYSNCSRAESSNAGQDDGTALKLWAVSCHLLGIRWR